MSNSGWRSTHLSMICCNLSFVFCDMDLSYDAYVLGFLGYGLCLGMDWMSRYGVVLDCNKRIIRLRIDGGHNLVVNCEPNIFMMETYLYALNLSLDKMIYIPIVKEFLYVFGEVSGLPPKGEIEFQIDFKKDTRPIVFPPRNITPKKRR